MACLSTRAPLRSFSALQSTIRPSCSNQRRSFSASQPKSLSAIDCIVWGPNTILDGFHSLGLPWYAAIPASAVLIRSTCGYIFSVRPRKYRAGIRAQLTPVVAAQLRNSEGNTPEKLLQLSRKQPGQRHAEAVLHNALHSIQKLWRFGRRFAVLGVIANLTALLASAQAIRMKCGARNGLVGMLFEGLDFSGYRLVNLYHSVDMSVVTSAEKLARSLGGSESRLADIQAYKQKLHEQLLERRDNYEARRQDQQSGATDAVDMANTADAGQHSDTMASAISNSSRVPEASSPYFDPSLQTEGFSWIQDLTTVDTSLFLPCLFYGVSIFTIMYRPSSKGASSTYWFLPSNDFSKQVSLFFSTTFFFISLHWPAAILLYMIPSWITGYVQNRYMDIVDPNLQGLRSCRRPLRMKSRQQFF